VPCDGPLSDEAIALDDITFQEWITDHGATDTEARTWLAEFADDAEDVRAMSMLGVAWTFNCSNALVGSPVEDWWRVRGGTQGPALALAARFQANITLSSPVRLLQELPSGVTRVTSDRLVVEARHVLMAGLSPPVLSSVAFDPPLGRDTMQLLSTLPLGTSLKYMVVYDSAWWLQQNFLGKVITTEYPTDDRGPVSPYISECIDDTPFINNTRAYGVLMCFIEGAQNRQFFQRHPSAAGRKQHVLTFIGKSFQNKSAAASPIGVVEHNWADDPYTRGAYSSYFPPAVLSGFWDTHQALRQHRLRRPSQWWVAGSDYCGSGMGYIDGAISSGKSAAEMILDSIGNQKGGFKGD